MSDTLQSLVKYDSAAPACEYDASLHAVARKSVTMAGRYCTMEPRIPDQLSTREARDTV